MVVSLWSTDDDKNASGHDNSRSNDVADAEMLLEEIPSKDAVAHNANGSNGCNHRGRCKAVCKQVANFSKNIHSHAEPPHWRLKELHLIAISDDLVVRSLLNTQRSGNAKVAEECERNAKK